jgi:ribosomal protein S18 acetylase RimI-like enzyme
MTPANAKVLAQALAEIDPWARYAFTPAALTDYLAATEADAPKFSISADGKLAGAVGVRLNWLRGPYLQFLGILPAFQHQGIGTQVLIRFESDARAARDQNLWVATSDFNTRALAFYERHGFSRVAVLDGLIGPGAAELLLRKPLAAP